MFQNCLLSPGNSSQLIEQDEGFCLGSHHEIQRVCRYMHKEIRTNSRRKFHLDRVYLSVRKFEVMQGVDEHISWGRCYFERLMKFSWYLFLLLHDEAHLTMKLSLVKCVS